MAAIDLSKRLNKSTDIVTQQNKQICNKIDDTEIDIKKHINEAEMCILEALENIQIAIDEEHDCDVRRISEDSIDDLF